MHLPHAFTFAQKTNLQHKTYESCESRHIYKCKHFYLYYDIQIWSPQMILWFMSFHFGQIGCSWHDQGLYNWLEPSDKRRTTQDLLQVCHLLTNRLTDAICDCAAFYIWVIWILYFVLLYGSAVHSRFGEDCARVWSYMTLSESLQGNDTKLWEDQQVSER